MPKPATRQTVPVAKTTPITDTAILRARARRSLEEWFAAATR